MKRVLLALALLCAPLTPAAAQHVLNLRDADIRAFIQDAARVTGRTFIIDPAVQGRVSVVTQRPLSRTEYFELFLSTMRANGFVAVPTAGGALRIQPIAGAASTAPVGGRRGSASGFVTEIFRLRHIEPAAAVETLRPLVSQNGAITASRNSIVVSDFADNIGRIRQILARIDVDASATRIVGLNNAGAREIAAALAELAPEGVSVVPVDSSNAVALRGDSATVARLIAIAEELDRRAASGSEIRVVFLEHADAEQLLPVLQQLLGHSPTQPTTPQRTRRSSGATGSSAAAIEPAAPAATSSAAAPPGGGIAPLGARGAVVTRFEGANAIVISATPDIQRTLGEVIRQLDIRRQQVLVEAIIVEISDVAAQRLGVQLFLSGLQGSNIPFGITNYSNTVPNIGSIAGAIAARELGGTTTTVTTATGSTTTTTSGAGDDLIDAAASQLAGINGGLFGLALRNSNAIFGAIINAVRSDNSSNILSMPSIMTLDNQEAHFLVGQEIPITTGEALSPNFDNAFRTVQRQNVGISLEVRPQINAGGTVKLDIRQEVSSIAGPVSSSFQDLILNKREFETTIIVDDGAIVGIGGLLDDNDRRTLDRIPLLGDIPILGHLFRSRGRSRARTNLMVFIRPTILRTAADAQAAAARRYNYVRGHQLIANPNREPTLDELVRDYLGAVPPVAPEGPQPTDQVVTPAEAQSQPQWKIPYAFARRHGLLPTEEGEDGKLDVAMRDGADPKALIELRRFLARPFAVHQVDAPAFDRLLSDLYPSGTEAAADAAGSLGLGDDLGHLAAALPSAEDLLDTSDDAPAIRLINGMIADAARQGVSDIHIEPYETGLVIRMRIDGVLRETLRMPAHVAPVVVSRVKVMARLDIAERRLPQDGRISLTLGGKLIDVRVSTLPSRAGERVVLRILDKDNAGIDLEMLGMAEAADKLFRDALGEPNGIVLVTGPTGSGKTTTLYAGLKLLNDGTRNILTVEDPVEYAVDGVGQTQINPQVGLTFAAGLRAILRQDPNIVMVGEIRDRETADIAVQSALTGHLVLSTVHTNDAIGAITRLRDLKVEAFLIASTLRAVLAQRLVRRLCADCRAPVEATGSLAALLGVEPGTIVHEPKGCPACGNSGYKGRIGLFEAVRVDDEIRRLINSGADETAIAAHGFRDSDTLSEAARRLVRAGVTSPEEAVRVSRHEAADA